MSEAYLGLGSNLGDKQDYLRQALGLLESECRVLSVSSFYSTEPVGYRDQDWFLNCAARVETKLDPQALLGLIRRIEVQLGRRPTVPNGPRTIDIDILLFDALVIDTGGLTIPHPRMHERLFVLVPLSEIAPDAVHPVLGETIRELRRTAPLTHRVEAAPTNLG